MRQQIAKRRERRERIYGALISAAALAVTVGQLWPPIGKMLPITTSQLDLISPPVQIIAFTVGLIYSLRFGIRSSTT